MSSRGVLGQADDEHAICNRGGDALRVRLVGQAELADEASHDALLAVPGPLGPLHGEPRPVPEMLSTLFPSSFTVTSSFFIPGRSTKNSYPSGVSLMSTDTCMSFSWCRKDSDPGSSHKVLNSSGFRITGPHMIDIFAGLLGC